MHMTTKTQSLSLDGLENVYDALANAIDSTLDSEKSELFLTKLCLLCAQHLGDEEQFNSLIQIALADL